MATNIFDYTCSSRTGLGDIGVVVDPFTGKTSTYVPVVTRLPNGPVIDMGRFFDSVQRQVVKGDLAPEIDQRLAVLKDTFNPGLAHHDGRYVMLVRYQNQARLNDVYIARSDDGIHWDHTCRPLDLPGLPPSPLPETLAILYPELAAESKWHRPQYYDPRITQMDDGRYLIVLAVDYDTVEPPGSPYINVCDNVMYSTTDFVDFEFVTVMAGATRNCIMFPRKIDGYYYAAGRPNTANRQHTVLLRSKDLLEWETASGLFSCGHGWMSYGGPGFPPFETEQYWVMGTHGVERHAQHRVHYRAGVCLIDKKTMALAAGPVPILDPQELYELTGVVDNVIFPTGVLFGDGSGSGIKNADTRIAIYYGGGDRIVHVGLTTAGKLIEVALGTYNPLC